MEETKNCKKCGRNLPLSEYRFCPGGKTRQGACKQCRRDQTNEWRRAFPEKSKASQKAWQLKNREYARAAYKKYKAEHYEEMLEYWKQYARDNSVRVKKNQSAYRKKNRDRLSEQARQYQLDHAKEIRAYRKSPEFLLDARIRAAARRRKIRGTVNPEDWPAIRRIYAIAATAPRVRCFYCHALVPRKLRHVDHVIPISKGGKHTPDNLVIACQFCNGRKHDKLPEEAGVLPLWS